MALLCVFLAFIFWLSYIYFCKNDCTDTLIAGQNFLHLLQWFLPIWATINFIRLGVVFRLNDNNDEPEHLFYVSLACLTLAYVFFAVFMMDFIASSQKAENGSLGFMLTLVTFLIAVASLMADRQTWDKSVNFVKARIVLSLMHFTLLLINPGLGILASAIFVPLLLVWPVGKIRRE
jgi:hypothetical protein